MPKEDTSLLAPAGESGRRGQLPAIEGARVFATTCILLVHWVKESHTDPSTPPEETWTDTLFGTVRGRSNSGQRSAASLAVELFFMMSGFVTLLSAPPPRDLREGMRLLARKLLRLAPMYYFSLVLFVVLAFVRKLLDGCSGGDPDELATLPLFLTIFGIQSWVPLGHDYGGVSIRSSVVGDCPPVVVGFIPTAVNGPTWFVSSLVGCFLVYTLVGAHLLRLSSTPARSIAAALAFAALRWLLHWATGDRVEFPVTAGWAHVFPLSTAISFLAGTFTAQLVLLLPEGGRVLAWRGWAFFDTPLFALTALALYPWPGDGFGHRFNVLTTLTFWPLFLFLTACTRKGLLLQALSHPAVVPAGALSYGAYCLQRSVRELLALRRWHIDSPHALVVYLFLCWLGAGICARFIEEPFRALTRDWYRAAGARPAAAPPPAKAAASTTAELPA